MTARCDGCHRSWRKVSAAPMLHDHVWRQLAAKRDELCFECMLDRSIKRQVNLTFADLLPCEFNLFHRPHSWFDLFMRREKQTPANLEEWRAALDHIAEGEPR